MGNVCSLILVKLYFAVLMSHCIDGTFLKFAENRPYIFLTGRVHPGESNASWVMKGSYIYSVVFHQLFHSIDINLGTLHRTIQAATYTFYVSNVGLKSFCIDFALRYSLT